MQKTTRQILFRPSETIKTGESHNDYKVINTTQVKDDTIEGKKIADWLKVSKGIINKSYICKEAKVDRANLDKYIKMGEIPLKHINSIKLIISKYGYK